MPTILIIFGWRHPDTYEISEAYSYQLTNPAKREIRKIIYDHFD